MPPAIACSNIEFFTRTSGATLRILADYVVVGRQLLADNRQPGSEAPN